jgi:hypothetical protein
MRITLSKIILTLAAICAVLVGLVLHLYVQVNKDRTEEIIAQSAICANNIPGEGLERRGAYLVGWLNVLVSGRHRIEVPGAIRVVVGRDIDLKSAPNDSVTLELQQGKYQKFIVEISANKPFHPIWTMPNGMEWEIPTWAMYAGGGALPARSALRNSVTVLPSVTKKDNP